MAISDDCSGIHEVPAHISRQVELYDKALPVNFYQSMAALAKHYHPER